MAWEKKWTELIFQQKCFSMVLGQNGPKDFNFLSIRLTWSSDRKMVKPYIQTFVRSSHRRCSTKKGVFRNFAKFARKHMKRISNEIWEVLFVVIQNFWRKHYDQWTEAATKGVLCKKVFLEISQSSQENIRVRVSFLVKLPGLRPAVFIKKQALAKVFSCEFYETFKNTFFTEHLWTTASVSSEVMSRII